MPEIISIKGPDHSEDAKRNIANFLTMQPGPLKNLTYKDNIMGVKYSDANLKLDDNGDIYYSYCLTGVKKSKAGYFISRDSKQGFSLKKNKLSIWFGKSILELKNLKEVLLALKLEWVDDACMRFMTKGLLEKVLSKKVTNPIDFFRAYLKAHRLKASPTLMYRMARARNTYNSARMYQYYHAVKDIDHMLTDMLADDGVFMKQYQLITDMVSQAAVLETKIDMTWSLKRMMNEHTEWTRKIMDLKSVNMDETVLKHMDVIDHFTPEGFTLLKSEKDVYTEGAIMKHCVYTNYWKRVQSGYYLVYNISVGETRATLGLNLLSDSVKFNQMYGIRNTTVNDDVVNALVEDLIRNLTAYLAKHPLYKREVESELSF